MTVEKTCGPNSRPLDKIVIHQDTLWMRCFWVVAKRNRDEGREVVKFCDVDDLVLEKSKLPISDLQAWLMDNAKVSGAGTASAGLPGYATEVEK